MSTITKHYALLLFLLFVLTNVEAQQKTGIQYSNVLIQKS